MVKISVNTCQDSAKTRSRLTILYQSSVTTLVKTLVNNLARLWSRRLVTESTKVLSVDRPAGRKYWANVYILVYRYTYQVPGYQLAVRFGHFMSTCIIDWSSILII